MIFFLSSVFGQRDTIFFRASDKYLKKIIRSPRTTHSFYEKQKIKLDTSLIRNSRTALKIRDSIYTFHGFDLHPIIIYTNSKKKVEMIFCSESCSEFKEFSRVGTLKQEGTYLCQDVKLGHWKYYYSTGQLKSEGTYEHGKKSGLWKYYKKNGSLKRQITY